MPNKKKKQANKKKAPKAKPVKRVKITQEMYLQHLIEVSERNIGPHGTSIDEFFQQQAERLKKELAELKASK